ncbi:hypothetical protein A7982_13155 [Minicystis rosea]|nr:hypothetical protein A7982_13155 [Minicystis rosea]
MIIVNQDYYPFVLQSYPLSSNTESDYRAMMDAMAKVAQRAIERDTYHVVLTLGGAEMSAAERKYVASLLETWPKHYMDRTVGSFVVVPNAIVRGVITALRWMAPKLVNVETVATIDDAVLAGKQALFRTKGIALEQPLLNAARRWLEAEVRRRNQTSSALGA